MIKKFTLYKNKANKLAEQQHCPGQFRIHPEMLLNKALMLLLINQQVLKNS